MRGGVTERLKELAWKASEGQKPSGGSNPPLSAIFTRLVKVGPVGSRARERREPGQVRKEAAISVRLPVLGVPGGFHLRGPCDLFSFVEIGSRGAAAQRLRSQQTGRRRLQASTVSLCIIGAKGEDGVPLPPRVTTSRPNQSIEPSSSSPLNEIESQYHFVLWSRTQQPQQRTCEPQSPFSCSL